MNVRRILLACLFALLSVTASAADRKSGSKYGPIAAIMALADLGALNVEIRMQGNTAADRDPDLEKSLRGDFPKALAAARGHRDLERAVKDWYSAASAFFAGVDPQGDERVIVYQARVGGLENRMKEAEARVNTELLALGYSP